MRVWEEGNGGKDVLAFMKNSFVADNIIILS
jgi:hypothetical protein